ncbi:MAG: Arc family DNA-binding protein [Burkholderiaceae bacterium]
MARTDPQVNFRMPQNLRDMLEDAAKENKRTLTAEIVARLEHSFELPDKLDSVMAAFKSMDAAYQEGDDIASRLIEVFNAQVDLSKLQQAIIDKLMKERESSQEPVEHVSGQPLTSADPPKKPSLD